VLYIGKAARLADRVRSYFLKGADHTPKTALLVSHIADLETMVTRSELEALILESNLVKRHRPRFNVVLRDDKQYPYLRLPVKDRFPRLSIVRRVQKDGALYFTDPPFGLPGVYEDPAKELRHLGEQLEKQVMSRPLVRRAESALQQAERTAARDVRKLPDHVPPIPGAGAAKAAALAAAAEVPLEISRAGRAVVQFEKQAAGAAHKLEAEARHALAHADGHVPHTPHSSLPSTVASRAESAVQHAARTPEDIAADHMYENVVDRLRRDLLAERERMGNLLGEWP